MSYMTFISLLPTFTAALLGMIYLLIGFRLFLSLSYGHQDDFGIRNLGTLRSAALSSLWLPIIVLLITGIIIYLIGSKLIFLKTGI